MAKPRVFLSSTYNDLRHVRERVGEYLAHFGFEPVLFESDNVYFDCDKTIDQSCYDEVKLCHMMVLIVSSRYGSPATGEEEKKKLHEKYNSITKGEYETARQIGMPIYTFVDKSVMADYQTFKKNEPLIEGNANFNFAHVDDINVFKFIDILQMTAIKTYDNVEEIENYLSNQIAGMLFIHLKEIQEKKKESVIFDSIKELKSISNNMSDMVDAVGKTILNNNDVYNDLIKQQNKSKLILFRDIFLKSITLKTKRSLSDNECQNIADIYINALTDKKIIDQIDINNLESPQAYSAIHQFCCLIFNAITDNLHNVISIKCDNMNNMMQKYKPVVYNIIQTPEYKNVMKELFKDELFNMFGMKNLC
ncbi:DUF4062 domain-containing protein [Bacteroides sp.]|uniref:DUF4062 domain-containing protein n=1 Tax=Bacteroides sp. TaxID=29523 RepID=UPI0025C0D9A8|nr:DUF4062 domain-containing protein [Bacteroides sp.]